MNIKIILLLSIFCSTAISQTINSDEEFNRFSINRLPPFNSVYSIIQDELGYIWIGSEEGLCRFDGYSSEIFNVNIDNTNSLSNGNISDMTFYDGKLWIATWGGGLNVYNANSGFFKIYWNKKNDHYSIGSDKIQSLLVDDSGYLWVGTNGGGLNKYDKKNDRFIKYINNPKDSNSISHNGMAWKIIMLFQY